MNIRDEPKYANFFKLLEENNILYRVKKNEVIINKNVYILLAERQSTKTKDIEKITTYVDRNKAPYQIIPKNEQEEIYFPDLKVRTLYISFTTSQKLIFNKIITDTLHILELDKSTKIQFNNIKQSKIRELIIDNVNNKRYYSKKDYLYNSNNSDINNTVPKNLNIFKLTVGFNSNITKIENNEYISLLDILNEDIKVLGDFKYLKTLLIRNCNVEINDIQNVINIDIQSGKLNIICSSLPFLRDLRIRSGVLRINELHNLIYMYMIKSELYVESPNFKCLKTLFLISNSFIKIKKLSNNQNLNINNTKFKVFSKFSSDYIELGPTLPDFKKLEKLVLIENPLLQINSINNITDLIIDNSKLYVDSPDLRSLNKLHLIYGFIGLTTKENSNIIKKRCNNRLYTVNLDDFLLSSSISLKIEWVNLKFSNIKIFEKDKEEINFNNIISDDIYTWEYDKKSYTFINGTVNIIDSGKIKNLVQDDMDNVNLLHTLMIKRECNILQEKLLYKNFNTIEENDLKLVNEYDKFGAKAIDYVYDEKITNVIIESPYYIADERGYEKAKLISEQTKSLYEKKLLNQKNNVINNNTINKVKINKKII